MEIPTSVQLPPHRARALSRGVQLGILAGVATVLAVAVALSFSHGAAANVSVPAARPNSPGTFRVSAEQSAGFRIATIKLQGFQDEQQTDGKIALNGDRMTPVFSPYSGRVTKVMAGLGDVVQAGAPLLAVEATEFAQGQNDLLTALSASATARSQLVQAQNTEHRKRALYEAKAGSLQDWEQSQADLVVAQNAQRSAEVSVSLVRNRLRILGKSDAEITALESANKLESQAYITAPISGTVTDRQVGPGQYIQASAANPVYSIGNLSTVWLVANVREVNAPKIHKGDAVQVRVLALPDRVFKAHISQVAPAVDPATRRVTVRAEVDNAEGLLKPEMFASFTIDTGKEQQAAGIPQEAIIYEGVTARIWIKRDDGSFESRPIKTGRNAGGMVEVLSGVRPGEQVVASGTLFIDRAAQAD